MEMSFRKRPFHVVESELREYELTLTKIIPRDIEQGNETVGEEIFHLLFTREWLEVQLQKHGTEGKAFSLWLRLQELDQILVAQREAIVEGFHPDYYRSERERLKMPRQYWWWYLDDLETAQLPEWVMTGSYMRSGVKMREQAGLDCGTHTDR
jgi:hypothetical protein